MKRICIALAVLALAMTRARAQEEEPDFVPFLKMSDFVLSASYGYPNWGKFNMEEFFSNSNYINTRTGGLAPITITGTYFYSDRISFSLMALYNRWGGGWEDKFFGFKYDFNVNRLRILFGAEYHFFDFEIKKVDWYAGLAIGGNSISINYESTDLGWSPRVNNYFMQEIDNIEYPLTARAYAGMRYFFNNNFGGLIELSYGGASMNFGLSYKF
jgi:hypothetical protein